ncbi:MAG: hypothetical protein R3F37_07515 [Candidatus Competibacteraceae bacterium]
MRPENPPLLSIALVSGVSLTYEILLLQLFSQVYWHHFAFLAISTALLGSRRCGNTRHGSATPPAKPPRSVLFSIYRRVLPGPAHRFSCAQRLPFNPLQNAVVAQPSVLAYGALYFAGYSFLCGAAAIVLMLRCFATRAGRVYGWDLCGAGGGALVIVLLMQVFLGRGLFALAGVRRAAGDNHGAIRLAVELADGGESRLPRVHDAGLADSRNLDCAGTESVQGTDQQLRTRATRSLPHVPARRAK